VAIRPYSIAVAAFSSFKNLMIRRIAELREFRLILDLRS
jgi:hypothetical protein